MLPSSLASVDEGVLEALVTAGESEGEASEVMGSVDELCALAGAVVVVVVGDAIILLFFFRS